MAKSEKQSKNQQARAPMFSARLARATHRRLRQLASAYHLTSMGKTIDKLVEDAWISQQAGKKSTGKSAAPASITSVGMTDAAARMLDAPPAPPASTTEGS